MISPIAFHKIPDIIYPSNRRWQMAKKSNAMNPLPSLVRASAWDAANMRMAAAGRSKWNRDDYNHAARTQERIIRTCYGRSGETKKDNACFIRFSIAEALDRAGLFTLQSDFAAVSREIDRLMAGEVAEAA
jgi:hypothetical protein